uniref:Uncharacterized protein n=1 Tax=Anguilla anguilla TaxID=7936 RepID=A0A0E9SGE9_ANGAN
MLPSLFLTLTCLALSMCQIGKPCACHPLMTLSLCARQW